MPLHCAIHIYLIMLKQKTCQLARMTVEIRWQKRKWGGAYFYPNEGTMEKVKSSALRQSSEDWLRVLPTVSVSFNVEVWGLGHVQRVLVSQNWTPSIFLSFSDKPSKMSKDTTPSVSLLINFSFPSLISFVSCKNILFFFLFFFCRCTRTHASWQICTQRGSQKHTLIGPLSAHEVVSEVSHVSDIWVITHPLDHPKSLGTFFCRHDCFNGRR